MNIIILFFYLFDLVKEVSSNDNYYSRNRFRTWKMVRAERVLQTVTYEWECIIQQMFANRSVQ